MTFPRLWVYVGQQCAFNFLGFPDLLAGTNAPRYRNLRRGASECYSPTMVPLLVFPRHSSLLSLQRILIAKPKISSTLDHIDAEHLQTPSDGTDTLRWF
jgi:hypothetical protein